MPAEVDKDALVARVRERAASLMSEARATAHADAVAEARGRELVADLDGLAHALVRQIVGDGANEALTDLSSCRLEGRARPDGIGYVVDAFPYGGSVIEGYHHRLTAVLPDGAVVLAEKPDDGPCVVQLHGAALGRGAAAAVNLVLDRADQDARVRVNETYAVWLRLRYAVLDRVRERFGWPALASGQRETLDIAVDGDTVRFTYTLARDRPWSGTATLDEQRRLSAASWDDR